MKIKAVFLMLFFGSLLLTLGSCSNEKERSSNSGVEMDSASMAKRHKDELTLSTLKDKKIAAEKKASEATSSAKEAKRMERDATDAADEANQAYETEEKAQRSRQQADDQSKEADKASDKADGN